MTSYDSTTTDLPQRTRPLRRHRPREARRLLEDIAAPSSASYIYSCAPPAPRVRSHFNPVTNETSYILTEVRVHEIGIRYNYEIRHGRGASWENEDEGNPGGGGGILDKAGNFFSNFFGGGDDEEDERGRDEGGDSSETNDGGSENLIRLEKDMVSQIWKNVLKDEKMTWNSQRECAGLVTTQDDEEGATRTRGRQLWRTKRPRWHKAGSSEARSRILEVEGGGNAAQVDALVREESAGANAMTEEDTLNAENTLDTENATQVDALIAEEASEGNGIAQGNTSDAEDTFEGGNPTQEEALIAEETAEANAITEGDELDAGETVGANEVMEGDMSDAEHASETGNATQADAAVAEETVEANTITGGDILDTVDTLETGNATGEDVFVPEESVGANATAEGDALDTLDTSDADDTTDEYPNYSTFSGTKLLGVTYQPLDDINHNGCLIPEQTCTSIRGQLSVAYSGLDEYSVIEFVTKQLRAGMNEGTFLPPDSPALNLEFVSSAGTVPLGGGASSYRLNIARGTALDEPVEEESYLSKYGVSFVCLVGILGAATVASVFVRYRKRQRRIVRAKMEEGAEWSEEDRTARHVQAHVEDGETKSTVVVLQELMNVPVINAHDTKEEVEICLSESKSFN